MVDKYSMESVKLPSYIQNALDKIAKENGFTDFRIESERSSVSGFGSDMFSVSIIDNQRDDKMSILCKMAPSEEIIKKMPLLTENNSLWNREALFYEKIAPLFVEFQKEKNLPENDQFLAFPKCYAVAYDEEGIKSTIFIEDLRPKKFRVWHKPNSTPIENLRLSMQELGKFHGVSFALKDQNPEFFVELKKLTNLFQEFVETDVGHAMLTESADFTIKSLNNEDHKDVIRDITKNVKNYSERIDKDDENQRFGVICHGDFHNNNIIYRLNEQGVAEDVRIVDWQCIRYVSPVIDILYSIFASTEKSLRDRELDNLFKHYHSSLSRTVALLGSDPEKLFSLNDMYDELKRCGNHALICSPMISKIYQSGVLNKIDKSFDMMNEGLIETEQMDFDKRINHLIGDIVALGLYRKSTD